MDKTIEVTDSTFEEVILKSKIPVVVDFWAPWCGPCRKLGPILDELADTYKSRIKVAKVNIDENLGVAKDYSISGLPSILIFNEGQPVERIVGLMSKSAITTNLEKHL